MRPDPVGDCGTQYDPAGHLISCPGTRGTARDSGVDLSLRLTEAMADFYVLERLEADGSKQASKLLGIHERYLAPRLSRYMSMICGGELRHVSMVDEESVSMSCGCHCVNCHECEDRRAYRIPVNDDNDDWRYSIDTRIVRFVDAASEYDTRSGAWSTWMDHQDREGPSLILAMAEAFNSDEVYAWRGGGYGGSAWADIAELCYNYEARKLAPRHFINMAWSLQHNGGSMFNKLWERDHLNRLMGLLEYQAEDSYTPLVRHASAATKALWRHRDLYRFRLDDHDSVWLGQQILRDSEVDW